MTKAPKKPDSRAKALSGMNRETLIKTVKQLDKRQTTLLNEIAALKASTVYGTELLDTAGAVTDRLQTDWKQDQAETKRIKPATLPNAFEEPPIDINPNSLETVEIEIKHPSEQKGFKIASRTVFPWETKPEGE